MGRPSASTIVTSALVAGLIAGYGIAIPVGAVATYLLTLTARTSAPVGAAGAIGVATADGLYALLAVVGGAALTGLIARVAGPLQWISGVVLLALAARIAWSAIRDHRSGSLVVTGGGPGTPSRAFAALLGITLLNPVTVLYFGALVLGGRANGLGGSPDAGWALSAVFVLGAFLASASWQLLLVAGGVALGRTLTGRTGRLITGLASSALIVILTVSLLI